MAWSLHRVRLGGNKEQTSSHWEMKAGTFLLLKEKKKKDFLY